MKPVKEMSFREQIGAAAKYGAYGKTLRVWGFHARAADRRPVVLTPEALESFVGNFSARDVSMAARLLTEAQPPDEFFAGWSDLDMLKLRAHLALRLGRSRHLSESIKNLALTRTYRRERSQRTTTNLYRDGTPGQQLSRGEREDLYQAVAEEIEAELQPQLAKDAAPASSSRRTPEEDTDDDFLIVHAFNLYTFPASNDEKWQISKSVTVRALRDGVSEYRNIAETAFKGAAEPELELLSGLGAHFERLASHIRANIPGFDYQVVIPFATPMREGEERSFSWIIRAAVDDNFLAPASRVRTLGFRPSRELLSARIGVQFALSATPERVGVITAARNEKMDVYDPDGETREVVDGYVEMTWKHPRVAHYYNLIWRW